MARRRRHREFEEARSPFVAAATELDAIYAAWDYCCAFTGEDLRREAAADPLGWLLRIGPGDGPGQLIPAATDAIYAYENYHLALGANGAFLVALYRVAPELLERLNPAGHLFSPADPVFMPNPAALKAHRTAFADTAD